MKKIDGDLTYLIVENGRIKLKEISQRIKKSSPRLKYNLKILNKEGIIVCPHSVIDYSYFGFLLFKVYLKGGFYSEEENKKIIANLKKNQAVTSIFETEGKFDFVIEMMAENPSKFNKEIQKISKEIEHNSYTIVLNVVTHLYSRSYLVKNVVEQSNDLIIGGDRAIRNFEANQLVFLKEINTNPLKKMSQISKKTKIHTQTLKSIFNKLKQDKVFRGTKYEISPNVAEIEKIKLFIKTHPKTQKEELEFSDFLYQTKEVVEMHKTIGEWDLEIDIDAKNRKDLLKIIRKIKENFKPIIKEIDTVEILEIHKKQYLPDSFLNS